MVYKLLMDMVQILTMVYMAHYYDKVMVNDTTIVQKINHGVSTNISRNINCKICTLYR